MLDIKLIRDDYGNVWENLERRGDEEILITLEGTLEHDKNWRKVSEDLNNLRAVRNRLSKEIAELRKEGEDASELISQTDQLLNQIQQLEGEENKLRIGISTLESCLLNIISRDSNINTRSRSTRYLNWNFSIFSIIVVISITRNS